MEPVELGLVYHVMTPRAESGIALPDNSATYRTLVPADARLYLKYAQGEESAGPATSRLHTARSFTPSIRDENAV